MFASFSFVVCVSHFGVFPQKQWTISDDNYLGCVAAIDRTGWNSVWYENTGPGVSEGTSDLEGHQTAKLIERNTG